MNIFRYDDVEEFFLGHHKTGLVLGVAFLVFLSVKVQNEYMFRVAKFQIFLWVCLMLWTFWSKQ